MDVPNLKMNNGRTIPQIGLGLYLVPDGDVAEETVRNGLSVGYRHFDSAQYYENESALGKAVKASDVPREEVFITTKIATSNFAEKDLMPSFERSLKELEMDYVDLLLLHFPVSGQRQRAWQDLEQIYEQGRAKSIGVSNYTIKHLEELLADCKVKPVVNQVELHVFLQQPELLNFCKEHDILVEAYSPLTRAKKMDDPILEKIASKHKKTIAQIMLRWCIEAGTVPLPKSTHKERMQENIDIFDFSLDDEDMAEIKTLDKVWRTALDPSDVE